MRKHYLALATVVVSSAMLSAQAPPAGQPLDPANNKLDEVLLKWEKAMTTIESLQVQIVQTRVDKVFGGAPEVYEGTAKYVKSTQRGQSSRASLDLHLKNRPEVYERFICTGTYLYEFAPKNKVIRIHDMPAAKDGQIADDNFLSFLFGMKAADAKKRYVLTYVPPNANDKWYYYVKVQPIAPADKAEFTEARLVISNSTFLPRQLWFQQPNQNETTWDFPKVVNGADIRVTEFAQPTLPAGWRFERVPAQTRETPRIIRQSGP
jgi:TIGR03009 family protein